MDGDQMARLEEAPFQWVFETGNFPPGLHRLSAAAVTVSGRELRSPVLTAEFLSKPEATRKTMLVIVPVLAVVFLVVGLGVLLQLRKGNSQEYQGGSYRNFGWNGGAICPKCRKPFARHLLSLNFLTRKLERCPYCGKWALVGRASLKELEAADLAATHQEKGATAPPRDDWGRKLEDSKYL
jgi:hypothetical protein